MLPRALIARPNGFPCATQHPEPVSPCRLHLDPVQGIPDLPKSRVRGDPVIRLETERLVIRDHVPEDLHDLFGLLSDPKVMHFIPDLQVADLEGARANLGVALEEAARPDRGKFFFAILEKVSGSYVGEIGFTVLEEAPAGGVVELGYFVLAPFWGKGLVTEAAQRVVRFAFEACGVERILIGCYQANAGSERIMIKLGATKVRDYEGDLHHTGESTRRVEYRLQRPVPE